MYHFAANYLYMYIKIDHHLYTMYFKMFYVFISRTSYYTGDMDLFGKYTNGMDTTSPSSPPKVSVPTSDIRKVGFWINFNVSDYKEYM